MASVITAALLGIMVGALVVIWYIQPGQGEYPGTLESKETEE